MKIASQNIVTNSPKGILMERELNNELLALLKKSGNAYFKSLVKFLCKTTNTNYCLVGKYNSEDKTITNQVFYANNKYVNDFKYNIKNTPCENVIDGNLCIYSNNIQDLFPKDKDLKTFGIESYIGLPLLDTNKTPIGLIVIMDNNPILNKGKFKEILKLVESKTELELERIISKETNSLSHKDFIRYFQNFQDVFFWISYDKNDKQIKSFVSPSVKNILGYSSDEYIKMDYNQLYHDTKERKKFLQLVKSNKQVKNYPLTLIKKNGSLAHVEVDSVYFEIELNGKSSYSHRGVIKDVTTKVKEQLRIDIAFLIAEKSQRRLINLNLLGEYIHKILKNVINISNMYIAILDNDNNKVIFPYFVDKHTDDNSFIVPYNKNGFTEHIIRKSKLLIINSKKENKEFHEINSLLQRGKFSDNLVGIPLKSEGLSVGAFVVQNYDNNLNFSNEDIELLKFIASQIAVIVDRKLWQDKLIQNEKYFKSLNENSSEIIGIINRKGDFEYISKSVVKILKYQPYELIGKNISDYITIPNNSKLARRIISNPSNNNLEVFIINDKKGKRKDLEVSFSKNIVNYKNEGIIFNAKDITNKVIAEKKRDETQNKLNTLHEIEKALISNKSLERILTDTITAIAKYVINADRISIGLVDFENKEIKILALHTTYNLKPTIDKDDKIHFDDLSSIKLLKKNKPFYVQDIVKLKNSKKSDKKNLEEGIQSYYLCPIIFNNKLIGTLNFGSTKKNHFDNLDIKLIKEITVLLAVVINDFILKNELEERKNDLTNIFNNANEGIVRVSPSGQYLDANEKMLKLTGYSANEFLKLSISDISQTKEASTRKRMEDLMNGKISELNFEENLLHKSGRIISCNITAKGIFNVRNEFEYFLSFITDISELKKANQQVFELKNAINNSASVLFTDIKGKILYANKSIYKKSGFLKPEIIGKTPQIFNSSYHSASFFDNLWNTILNGKIWKGEIKNKTKDGSFYWVFSTISPIFNEVGEIVQFISIQFDITKEKNAQTNLVREVIEAQEQERERFAMEIHDGLGQTLLATKMNLNAISCSLDDLDQETKRIYNNSVHLLTESVKEARNISHGLMSRVLNKFGLAYAVNEIISDINSSLKLKFIFQNNIENQRFIDEVEMGIYRTLQELINNIIKHSHATIAYLKITKNDTELNILIEDNGVGLNKQTILNPKSGGIGLRNMRSRVEYLGGQFEIDNKIKKGTRINIRISLKN
jgi:PAS domain S-box-containing protein